MIRPVVIPESIPSDPYAWELIGIPAGDIALLIYRTARAVNMLIEEHNTLIQYSNWRYSDERTRSQSEAHEAHPDKLWDDPVEQVVFEWRDPNDLRD